MTEIVLIDPELWASTRAGARAGRGFRYQDVATALLAVQAWAVADWSAVVPEGVDDATLHGEGREFRVQMKSRHDPRGLFDAKELATHIAHSAADVATEDLQSGRTNVVLVLERPADGITPTGLDNPLSDIEGVTERLAGPLADAINSGSIRPEDLLAATHLLVIPNPAEDILDLVVARTGCVEAAGRLVADRHDSGSGTSQTRTIARRRRRQP